MQLTEESNRSKVVKEVSGGRFAAVRVKVCVQVKKRKRQGMANSHS